MDGWMRALDGVDLDGFDLRETALPEYDGPTVLKCRELCESNLCGRYGTCWACPPGFDEHMDTLSRDYDSAILMSRTFPCDPKDRETVEGFNSLMKAAMRRAITALRGAGFRCRGLADGGCDLCAECAYPEPCRHPDLLLPSISVVGIDMSSYLATVGERFEFRDDAVTFYGVILLSE